MIYETEVRQSYGRRTAHFNQKLPKIRQYLGMFVHISNIKVLSRRTKAQ